MLIIANVASKALLGLLAKIAVTLCLINTVRLIGGSAGRGARTMAWRSSGSSNAALINNLAANGLINSDRVKNAMLNVRYRPRDGRSQR